MADAYIVSAKEKREFRRDQEGLTERTMNDYRKLAQSFYTRRLGGESPTPKRIADALRKAAGEYRPGYFRKLRNALMYDQVEKGYFEAAQRLKATKNPITNGEAGIPVKAKQRRSKSVSHDEFMTLFKAVTDKGDADLGAALTIADLTGCRPAEMLGIEDRGGSELFVPGAKQSKGVRGLDRVITFSQSEKREVLEAVEILRDMEPGRSGRMHKIQSRLDRITKRLWPRRKARPTLYSFRHQLGADLKASGMSRIEIAYVMGHQSTESVEVYGDRRKKASRGGIKPAPGADMKMIRENHDLTPGPKAPTLQNTYEGPSLG